MIQLFFKGQWSNSCTEVPDGTMITVQTKTSDAIYSTLKGMGCSHGAASFAADAKNWETAQERDKRIAKQSASKSDKTESHEKETTFSDGDDTIEEYDGGDTDNSAYLAQYLEIKKPVVKKELAQIAKRREKIASDTSISTAERLKETLNCILQAYHSQTSVIVDSDAQSNLDRKTISELKQVIRQTPIPDKADELTDFIKYVKSGAIKPKMKMMGIFDIISKILDFVLGGGSDDDYNYNMEDEDKIIGNLLYEKLLEIANIAPEHPLIVPIIRKNQLMKAMKVVKRIIILAILLFVCYLVWDLVSFIIEDFETW